MRDDPNKPDPKTPTDLKNRFDPRDERLLVEELDYDQDGDEDWDEEDWNQDHHFEDDNDYDWDDH